MAKLVRVISILALLLIPTLGIAQKTDTLWFYNGDRAVCEIKSLAQGKMNIKTVAMGTISVEWRNISDISTDKFYDILLSDHSTFYGRLGKVDSARNITIAIGIFAESVPIKEIVKLDPLNNKFWQQLDGQLNAGFSFTEATQNVQLSSSGDVNYRTNRTSHELYFTNNISKNATTNSEKMDGGYRFKLFYRKNIYNALDLRWERNTELGIDSRLITTLSAGYSPVENRINVFSVEVGGSLNREYTTEQVVSDNSELLLRLKYDLFVFEKPKIFIKIQSETFPSLTVKERIRSNVDADITWEIFSNFTLGFSYWGNYDSKPVNANGLQYDFGYTTSIGYKF